MKTRSSLFTLVRVVLLFTLLALAVSGCGGSAPQKVKIAIFLPSEISSLSTEWQNAANLALNEAGGKAGDVVVELVILDESDKDKKEAFSDAVIQKNMEEMLKDQSVIAFVGPSTSGSSKMVIPILNQASVAEVSLSATWPGLTKPGYGPGEPGTYYPTGRRNFFRITGADDGQGIVGAKWAKQLGYQNVFIIHGDDAYGTGIAGVFEVTAKDVEVKILGKESFPANNLTSSEINALVPQVLDAKPDMIYVAANTSVRDLVLALRQADSQIPIMVPDGLVNQEVVDLLGADLTKNLYGTIATLPPEELGTSAAETFIKNYEKAYGEKPTFLGALMYEGLNALLSAISKAKTPSREEVLKAMQNLGEYNGVYGTWHFDKQGDISLITASGYQIQDGKWKFMQALK